MNLRRHPQHILLISCNQGISWGHISLRHFVKQFTCLSYAFAFCISRNHGTLKNKSSSSSRALSKPTHFVCIPTRAVAATTYDRRGDGSPYPVLKLSFSHRLWRYWQRLWSLGLHPPITFGWEFLNPIQQIQFVHILQS